jgi:hypothetical protein
VLLQKINKWMMLLSATELLSLECTWECYGQSMLIVRACRLFCHRRYQLCYAPQILGRKSSPKDLEDVYEELLLDVDLLDEDY